MNKFRDIRPNPAGDYPRIHPAALIDPSAQIIGNVIIEKNVFVAFLAVIRADERGPEGAVAPIVIGEEANIQDGGDHLQPWRLQGIHRGQNLGGSRRGHSRSVRDRGRLFSDHAKYHIQCDLG